MSRATKSKNNDTTFEMLLSELENVVSQLERGDLPLDQSLDLFEQGVNLSYICRQKLDAAERRVEVLLKDKNGELVPIPFGETV